MLVSLHPPHLLKADFVRDLRQMRSWCQNVLGEAAIHGIPRVILQGAEVLTTRQAKLAGATA